MADLDNKIKILLQQNIEFLTSLEKYFDKFKISESEFLAKVCIVAIRENRQMLSNMQKLTFEPGDTDTEEYIQTLGLDKDPGIILTEDDKRDLEELYKIWNTPDPKLNWFQKLLTTGKKEKK